MEIQTKNNANDISEIIKFEREFFQSHKTLDITYRKACLNNLLFSIDNNEKLLLEALQLDLGKSQYEAYMTEIGIVYGEIRFTLKNIEKWLKPKKVKSPFTQFYALSRIYPEPYGIVLIMSPWNYPFLLSILPLIGAIAAGNCAVIKPSNYSFHTSNVINKIIIEAFDPSFVQVVLGGREANSNLLKQKFDYIFFTGGSNVGKVVMEAASKYLTPISLELGGKSPCIVDETSNLEVAAKRIVWGKFINAGQTCVAPDYVCVKKEVKQELLEKMKGYILSFYNLPLSNTSTFPKIINEHHFKRLLSLMENEEIYYGGKSSLETHKIEPTIIENVNWDSPIMQDEIFGPLLPIISYDNLEDVITKINERPKPLALYLFTKNKVIKNMILKNISYGGGVVNDTLVHLGSSYLPFGGVGESGMGSYHGKASFDTFSHFKSVMVKTNLKLFDIPMRYPPFNKEINILKKFMK